jgi:hypothetical protein
MSLHPNAVFVPSYPIESVPTQGIPTFPLVGSGSNLSLQHEPNPSAAVMQWQIPVIARTNPRRFWEFKYDALPISSMLSSVPLAVVDAMARVAKSTLPPIEPEILRKVPGPPPLPQAGSSGASSETEQQHPGAPADHFKGEVADSAVADDLRFGALTLDLSRLPNAPLLARPAPPAPWVAALRLHPPPACWRGARDDGGEGDAVPLAELDLLCLLLHDVLRAGRPAACLYVRLWAGGGDGSGVLAQWGVEEGPGGQASCAPRACSRAHFPVTARRGFARANC